MAYEFATIKNITLPTGNTYSLKDAQAQLILAGFADAEGSVKAYIDQMADLAFDVIVLTALPHPSAPTEEDYNTYKNKIVLIPDEDAEETGAYLEYVIVRTGTSEDYDYTWEPIGTTQVDLSNYLTDISYTDNTHTLSQTKNGITSSVHQFGALADKSSATGSYTKPTGSGSVTIPSTFEFAGTADQAISASGTQKTYVGEDTTLEVATDDGSFVQSVSATKNSSAVSITATGGSVGTMTTVDTSKFTQAQLTTKNFGFSSSQDVLSSATVSNETLVLGKVTAGTQDVLSEAVFGNDFASNGVAPTFPTYSVPAETFVVSVDDSDKGDALISAYLSNDDGSSEYDGKIVTAVTEGDGAAISVSGTFTATGTVTTKTTESATVTVGTESDDVTVQ